jgi:uncharacterized protein YaiI (UPF0178 family)
MATWALHRQLRDSGLELGGPKPYDNRDRQAFANGLEQLVNRLKKRAPKG